MGNELSNSEITLPKNDNEFQLNEPKSPEFIFNNSFFKNKKNSKDLKNFFNESLLNDSKSQNLKKSFSKEDINKKLFQEGKIFKNLTLTKENLNLTQTTNISSDISSEDNIIFDETPIETSVGSLEMDIREIYKFKDLLGGGHFGTVRSAFRRFEKAPHKLFAIKSISKKNLSINNLNDLIKEVDIISSLDHPNIIKFFETYNDNYYFHIVMELCRGKDLLSRINEGINDEKIIANIIMKILYAISYCHSKGISHRDLKPENIIFETPEIDSDIKLIDFGLSKKFKLSEKLHSLLGTPYYVAPEVLTKNYNEKCDLWSVGIITYLLIVGDVPFRGKNNNDIFNKIIHENINFNSNKWKNYSKEAKNFVKLLLQKDFNKRPSAKEALNHNWFISIFNKINKSILIEPNIFIALKNYKPCNILKKLVYKYIINSMGHGELKKYKNALFAFDSTHNGYVNLNEINKVFELLKNDISDEQVKKLMNATEGKKYLNYTEFIMCCLNLKEVLKIDKLESAFRYFDINNDGYIDASDIKKDLLRFGKKILNDDDVKKIIKEVEKNENYCISKKDFFNCFNNIIDIPKEYLI